MVPPKPKPKTKYTWSYSPDGGMACYPGSDGMQTLTNLWDARELTTFHDAELARATKEINAILSQIEKSNKDPDRSLSFIKFQNRHFLVWASYGVVGSYDDDATIIKALKLKVK